MIKPFVWMDGTEFNQFREPSGNTEKVYESNNVTFYKNIKKNDDEINKINHEDTLFLVVNKEEINYYLYINKGRVRKNGRDRKNCKT